MFAPLRTATFLLLSLATAAPLPASPATEPAATPTPAIPTREENAVLLVAQRKNIYLFAPFPDASDKRTAEEMREKGQVILDKIPSDQIELLLKEASVASKTFPFPGTRQGPYLFNILRRDFTDKEKPVIVAYLREFPDLIQVVAKHRWAKDAEPEILHIAKSTDRDPATFVSALLQIDSPAARELLPPKLLQGSTLGMAQSFRKLGKENDPLVVQRLSPDELPWLNIAPIIDRAWNIAKKRTTDDAASYAPIAACYGHRDALVLMAKRLEFEYDARSANEKNIQLTIEKTLPKLVPLEKQTPEAIARFVFANRHKLVFDQPTGTWSLPR